jgi:vanillate/3-O-methylgallate O-demethylase
VFRAGKPYGIERLGWKTYFVNHVEGGFPQQTWTFLSAAHGDPGFQVFNRPDTARAPLLSGSVDPADVWARFRTPVEVGWEKSIRFDHDFVGRAALEKEVANPRRTIVTLVWNSEDVIDVYASMFRDGEDYTYIEIPTAPHGRGNVGHADFVLKDHEVIGISGTIYSYYYRRIISLCSIDIGAAAIGTDVVVRWGEFGKQIKNIRAEVARFPFLYEGRNQDVDVRAMPPHVAA